MIATEPAILSTRTPRLVEAIGNTPLIEIAGLDIPRGVRVLGKAEWWNPGGSVKDRTAWSMIRAAHSSGQLAGRTVLDATSGNTGIALAWLGSALGFPVELCVPANVNHRVRELLETLGAHLVLTDPLEGTDGAQVEARRRVEERPDHFVHTDQYSNSANWLAHYEGTGPEIWEQTGGRITHLVCGLGTTGTLVGCSRRLREMNPFVEVIGVQPDSPYHALEGLKHLATSARPAFYDPAAHQRLIEVRSEDAIDMARRQARNEVPIGWSAGAALVGAERVAQGLEHGLVVAVLPDGAWRYQDDRLWTEEP